MNKHITHDREKETIEAKAKWFQSLSLEERMDIFCQFTNLILENNPKIVRKKYAKPTSGRIQIIRKP